MLLRLPLLAKNYLNLESEDNNDDAFWADCQNAFNMWIEEVEEDDLARNTTIVSREALEYAFIL